MQSYRFGKADVQFQLAVKVQVRQLGVHDPWVTLTRRRIAEQQFEVLVKNRKLLSQRSQSQEVVPFLGSTRPAELRDRRRFGGLQRVSSHENTLVIQFHGFL